ncbi:putative ribose-phosphate diphosphokinase [Helianthus anomalus]
MFYGSTPAIERFSSGLFQEVIIANTLPVSEKNYLPQLTVLLVQTYLARASGVCMMITLKVMFYIYMVFLEL